MSATDYIIRHLNPTQLSNLEGYRFRDKGFSGQVYTDDQGQAVKLYNPELPVDAVHFEVSVLKELQSTSLPTLKLVDAVQMQDQWGFRYHWIEALPVDQAMRARGEDLELIARALAKLHTELHRIPGFDFVPNQKAFFTSSFDRHNFLEGGRRERLLALLDEMPDPGILCHGDFNPRNTLMDQTQAYVIDWQRTFRGHPLADVAKTWVKVSFHAHGDGKAEEHEKAGLAYFMGTYLGEYESRTDFDRGLFLQWVEIVAGFLCRSPEQKKREWYKHLIDMAENSPNTFHDYVFGAVSG